MAKCVNNRHKWVLMNLGASTWVTCTHCPAKFAFSPEFNGAEYRGEVPEKYQHNA
jgi:hypothetical protein